MHAFGACRTRAEAEILVSPLLILVAILIGSSIGDWLGGSFGAFVAALLSIPCAAALQVITRELWQATVPGGTLGSGPGLGPQTRPGTAHLVRKETK